MNRSLELRYRLSFRHLQFIRGRRRGETYAVLEMMKGGDILRGWIGVAICSRKDAFVKHTGRQLALSRLLDAIPAHEYDARRVVSERFDDRTSHAIARVGTIGDVIRTDYKVDCQGTPITGH